MCLLAYFEGNSCLDKFTTILLEGFFATAILLNASVCAKASVQVVNVLSVLHPLLILHIISQKNLFFSFERFWGKLSAEHRSLSCQSLDQSRSA